MAIIGAIIHAGNVEFHRRLNRMAKKISSSIGGNPVMKGWINRSFAGPGGSLLPLGLLLLALSTVFIFGGDRGHFYRAGRR